MSRIGKMPVSLPGGVETELDGTVFTKSILCSYEFYRRWMCFSQSF